MATPWQTGQPGLRCRTSVPEDRVARGNETDGGATVVVCWRRAGVPVPPGRRCFGGLDIAVIATWKAVTCVAGPIGRGTVPDPSPRRRPSRGRAAVGDRRAGCHPAPQRTQVLSVACSWCCGRFGYRDLESSDPRGGAKRARNCAGPESAKTPLAGRGGGRRPPRRMPSCPTTDASFVNSL